MQLTIYSLKGVQYEGAVKSFNVKTRAGEITILDNHRPLITLLEKGTARIIDEAHQTHEVPITSGFLELTPEHVLNVLVD